MRERIDTKLDILSRQLRPVLWHIGAVSFFINLLVLPVSLYALQVFDRVMATGSLATLFWLTFAMVLLFAVAGFLHSTRSIMLLRVGDWLYKEIAQATLPLTLTQSAIGGQKGVQNLRDAGALKQFLGGTGLSALLDAPWSVLYILVLFVIHPLLGVLVTTCAVALLALAWLNEVMMKKPLHSANSEQLQSMQELDFATRNSDVIEAMGMAGVILDRWNATQNKVNALQAQAGGRSSVMQGATKFVRLTLQVFVTGAAAWLALKGQVTMGAIIASSILASRALAPFEAAIVSWKGLTEARQAYARLHKLLEAKPRSEGISLPTPHGDLFVEQLSYMAPNQQVILRGVNFGLEAGELLGIVGPSGAGKTTLARLIMGILPPSAGMVRLDSANVYTWPREEFGRFVGYLPQDVELFNGSVKDNIARMQPDAAPEAIIYAAQLAGAHELILHLPQGYETDIGTAGANLSAGQRQRIGLARAFYGLPRLLMLDEPDANLDDAGTQALVVALKQAKLQRITTLVISHRKSILAHADKLLVLRNGMVDTFGPAPQVADALNKAAHAGQA